MWLVSYDYTGIEMYVFKVYTHCTHILARRQLWMGRSAVRRDHLEECAEKPRHRRESLYCMQRLTDPREQTGSSVGGENSTVKSYAHNE